MRTRIKFCGFRREQDILRAVALGVDAIGLIVVPGSSRALDLSQAATLRRAVPPFVTAVLLVKDPDPCWLLDASAEIRPDVLQCHGTESAETCQGPGLRYLKAVPMGDAEAARSVFDAHRGTASGWVLDSHSAGGLGGSGQTFDWSRVPDLDQPIVLAGGLHADNVAEAIRRVRPFAVDVAGGIESAPGIKDLQRMARFVRAVREADLALGDLAAENPASPNTAAASNRANPGSIEIESLNQAGTT